MLPENLMCDTFVLDVVLEDGLGDHGKFEYGKLSIFINANDHYEVQFSTMLHEYGHMVYRLCCNDYDAAEDEKFAAMFEQGTRWLRENTLPSEEA